MSHWYTAQIIAIEVGYGSKSSLPILNSIFIYVILVGVTVKEVSDFVVGSFYMLIISPTECTLLLKVVTQMVNYYVYQVSGKLTFYFKICKKVSL